MRFGITDLLLMTTLVAVYATGWSFLPPPPSYAYSYTFLVPMAFLAVIPIWAFGLIVYNHRRLRRVFVSWRIERWWDAHLLFVTLFAVFIGAFVYYGIGSPTLLPMFIAYHILFLSVTPVAIGESGVLARMMLMRREDYEWRLDQSGQSLHYRLRPEAMYGWQSLNAVGKIRVPGQHLDAVRAWLQASEPHRPAEGVAEG